jgi:hypothetical protein
MREAPGVEAQDGQVSSYEQFNAPGLAEAFR